MLRTKSALKQQQFVAVAEAAAVDDDNDAAVVGGRVAAADETLSTTYLLLMGMVLLMVVERQYNNILWIRTRPGCRYIIRNHTHNSSTALRGWEYLFIICTYYAATSNLNKTIATTKTLCHTQTAQIHYMICTVHIQRTLVHTRHSAKYSLCLIWTRFVHVARSYSTDALTIYTLNSHFTLLTPPSLMSRFKICIYFSAITYLLNVLIFVLLFMLDVFANIHFASVLAIMRLKCYGKRFSRLRHIGFTTLFSYMFI